MEENRTKVLVMADSTAMWIRPYRNHKSDFTYVELLRQAGITVDVLTSPGMTSKEVLHKYWNEMGTGFYDVCIVSVGINDLTPRSYPRWMWKVNNYFLIKRSLSSKIYGGFYRLFTNSYIQKVFSKYGLSKPWISVNAFRDYLAKFQELVLKESDSKIIYLSLPQVSERVSSLLYGINENVLTYKAVLNNFVDSQSVFQVDLDALFKEDVEKYNQEGIHYTAEGHLAVFNRVNKLIKEIK